MNFFLDFFKNYYILIIVTISTLALLFNNNFVSRRKELYARIVVVVCLFVAFFEYSERVTALYPNLRILRLMLSSLVYVLKPAIIVLISHLVLTDLKKEAKYIYIPLIVCVVVYLLPFIPATSKWVYYFDEIYDFKRGPLGFTSHVISGVYLIYLGYKTYKSTRLNSVSECILVFASIGFIVLSVLLETFDVIYNIVWPTVAIAICFYYFYLYTQISKRDALTGLLNRVSYYKDAKIKKNSLTAVISLDMNGLKMINDTLGHEQGDIALMKISQVFLNNIDRKQMKVYRKGGDEFNILCFGSSRNNLEVVCNNIKKEIASTKYSVSIGFALLNECDDSFEEVEILADKRMYSDKAEYYSHLKEPTSRKYLAGEIENYEKS